MARIPRWIPRLRCAGALITLALLVALAGCRQTPPTDTGFIGSWGRELRGGQSTIGIWAEGDTLRFRWNQRYTVKSELGPAPEIRCGIVGPCEEYSGQEKIYEYNFRTFRRDGTDLLFLECEGVPVHTGLTPLQYIDQLEVQPGGLELWSSRVELNGKTQKSGPVKFTKISDDPF